MVVLTLALKEFIKSGIIELEIPVQQVIHWEKWDGSEIDFIIVDEAQDFKKNQIDDLNNARSKSIMLYGDSQQQIYQDAMSIEGIASHLSLQQKELTKNYRLPKEVASFVSHLCEDKELENKCVKEGAEKPRIKKFDSWQKELDFIIDEIKTRNYTDVGILVPYNTKNIAGDNNITHNVQIIHEYFESVGYRHEFKMNDDQSVTFELDFDSENPKVLTFHSSKGLQFETVFVPFCDYPIHDKWFIEKYKNPFYVALTRTSKNLYITYSTRLSPFLQGVSATKYD
jgi:superfamily I DNA/RNA helicase